MPLPKPETFSLADIAAGMNLDAGHVAGLYEEIYNDGLDYESVRQFTPEDRLDEIATRQFVIAHRMLRSMWFMHGSTAYAKTVAELAYIQNSHWARIRIPIPVHEGPAWELFEEYYSPADIADHDDADVLIIVDVRTGDFVEGLRMAAAVNDELGTTP